MRLLRLTSKSDECWAHIPALREAIAEAGVHFQAKGCPTVIDRIVANFAAEGMHAYETLTPAQRRDLPDPHTTAVWYVWDDAEARSLGHLVALQSEWDGEVAVYVYQLWVTPRWAGRRSPVFRALQDTAAVELDHYARARGSPRVLMYTIRASRFWTKRFGFKPRRYQYEHLVTP